MNYVFREAGRTHTKRTGIYHTVDVYNRPKMILVDPSEYRQINIGKAGVFVCDGKHITSGVIQERMPVTPDVAKENPHFKAGEDGMRVQFAFTLVSGYTMLAVPKKMIFPTFDAANEAWLRAGWPKKPNLPKNANSLTYN